MMRFCAKCGAQIQENVKFCPKCGAKIPEQYLPDQSENGKATAPI